MTEHVEEPAQPTAEEAAGTAAEADLRQEWVRAAATFVDVYPGRPDLATTIEDVLDRYLQSPVDNTVYRRLGFALNQVIGGSGGTFVLSYTGSSDPDSFLTLVDEVEASDQAKDDAKVFLRRLQALYGYQAEDAMRMRDRNPHNWTGLARDVSYSVEKEEWSFRLDIDKVNGEKVHLEMDSESALRLATGVLRGVNAIDVPSFDDAVGELMTEMSSLFASYGYEVQAAPGDGAMPANADNGAAGLSSPPLQPS